jgi:hypothetical protein
MRIPNKLREAIRNRLLTDNRPMTSKQIAEVVNPEVAQGQRKTPREMAFVLKQMKRDGDIVVAKATKNGLTPHGNERVRVEYTLNHEVADPDIITEDD